jgi:PhnB protein
VTSDPFDALAVPDDPILPRPQFTATLRAKLAAQLDAPTAPTVPTIDLPPRSNVMTSTTTRPTTHASVTPYLTVHDGAGALDWYADVFGAVIGQRVVGGDGTIAHAEFTIGVAPFYLSDEFPDMGVTSPRTLGGTTVAIHLTVGDVDAAFGRAVDAGAESLSEPADQPHGARHGTLLDPYGHRWMLSQHVRTVPADEYARAMTEYGFTVTGTSAPSASRNGRVWPAVNATDARATIRFLVDVLGFEESLVVPGEDASTVAHSQLRWPDGGVVQVGSADRDGNVFSQLPTGAQSIYLVTADPTSVYDRCVAAGVRVVIDPIVPDYDPSGLVFTVADTEGNLWSVGTYAGEPEEPSG